MNRSKSWTRSSLWEATRSIPPMCAQPGPKETAVANPEKILGAWIAARSIPRSDLVIATKVSQHPEFPGLAPENVARAIDASLGRLGLDYVDIYFAH